jgi:hypothetical protein
MGGERQHGVSPAPRPACHDTSAQSFDYSEYAKLLLRAFSTRWLDWGLDPTKERVVDKTSSREALPQPSGQVGATPSPENRTCKTRNNETMKQSSRAKREGKRSWRYSCPYSASTHWEDGDADGEELALDADMNP